MLVWVRTPLGDTMLQQLLANSAEPLTLNDVKLHLRIAALGSGAQISASIGTNSYVQSLSVIAGGSGYPSATTTATLSGGSTGTTATATLTINGGVITGAAVAASGSGYTAAPVVVLSSGDFGIEDDRLTGLIGYARERAEWHTQRAFMTQSFLFTTSPIACSFDWNEILLPKPPLIAVQSVNYVDSAGTVQTMSASDYQVVGAGVQDSAAFVRVINQPAYDQLRPDALQVRFTAGYASAALVPWMCKQMMLQAIGQAYRQREEYEEVIDSCIQRMGDIARVWRVGT